MGPEDPKKLPSGEHVIVSTKEAMNAPFASVTYNRKPLTSSFGRIKHLSNSIVFKVPTRGLKISVR